MEPGAGSFALFPFELPPLEIPVSRWVSWKGEREQSLRLGCVRVVIQHWESKLFSWML